MCTKHKNNIKMELKKKKKTKNFKIDLPVKEYPKRRSIETSLVLAARLWGVGGTADEVVGGSMALVDCGRVTIVFLLFSKKIFI